MNLFGLLGYPLEHSFSKKYFSEKFKKENITDSKYENFEISDISEIQEIIKNKDLKGLNVTIPYKEKILQYVDVISDEVKEINSANTLKIQSGKIYAFNTDYLGFSKSLANINFNKKKIALILGSGGSSKAIAYSLSILGIDFKIVSRGIKQSHLTYEDLDSQVMDQTSLIINTTPLGMYPKVDASPNIPYELLNENHFCYDLVYNPEQSEFLKKGKVRGALTKNGLEMLILQAEESWRIWNSPI